MKVIAGVKFSGLVFLAVVSGLSSYAQRVPLISGTALSFDSGEPLANVLVQLTSESKTVLDVTTNATGKFQFEGNPGRYSLIVRRAGYVRPSGLPATIPLTIEAGRPASDIRAYLQAAATLRGRVLKKR